MVENSIILKKIFFKQLRVGQYGRIFWIYKFKTMENGKVTKIGRFLRKWKLDELPQLWNVLKGDMTIIGPRPEELKDTFLIPDNERKIILSVKPGLTDLATLFFINENDMRDNYLPKSRLKSRLQILHLRNKSLLLDFKILCKTLKKLLKE